MNGLVKKRFVILVLLQVAVIVISLIYHRQITLLTYINITFYISAAFILIALLIYTIHSGFFDVISKSFNLFSTKRKWMEIPVLSDLFKWNSEPLLFYGLSMGLLMLIALFFYYH